MSLNSRHDHDPSGYDSLRGGWLNRRRLQHFQGCVADARPDVVVEIGSGTARMLCAIAQTSPGVRFIGVEPLAEYVTYGRALIASMGLSNVELHEAAGERLGEVVEDGTADLVISSDVLHHVRSLPDVVANVRAVVRAGARWSLVEPSALNPYVGAFQALTRGERNFRTRPFLREAASVGWRVRNRGHIFLIPAAIDQPPGWLMAMERKLERVPVLGGAVTMDLVASARAGDPRSIRS